MFLVNDIRKVLRLTKYTFVIRKRYKKFRHFMSAENVIKTSRLLFIHFFSHGSEKIYPELSTPLW